MDEVVASYDVTYGRLRALSDDDIAFLQMIQSQLPIVADVSRADVLLCGWLESGRQLVLAHARPHSVAPVYVNDLAGLTLAGGKTRFGLSTLLRLVGREPTEMTADGAPVVRRLYPIKKPGQQSTIGMIRVETNLLENERQHNRSPVFQRAVLKLQKMAQYGWLAGAEELSPFGETSGIIVADRERIIRYASGVASNLYRRIGYPGGLQGRPLKQLDTVDNDLARQAMKNRVCVEQKEEAAGRSWVKKAIPLLEFSGSFVSRWLNQADVAIEATHVLLIVRDTTESLRRERELRVKTALIQELHHRVKNDLQTIAALLRIQARRMRGDEAKTALGEAVSRILSVAVIHEFLSNQDSRTINIRDVSNRILTQMHEGMLDPEKRISIDLEGPPIYLPSRKATACALVINELLQNAVEHGFEGRQQGSIHVRLEDEGDSIVVQIRDDGLGIPEDIQDRQNGSLGLQIVQTLVKEDLNGTFVMRNNEGTEAIVRFPKPVGGD